MEAKLVGGCVLVGWIRYCRLTFFLCFPFFCFLFCVVFSRVLCFFCRAWAGLGGERGGASWDLREFRWAWERRVNFSLARCILGRPRGGLQGSFFDETRCDGLNGLGGGGVSRAIIHIMLDLRSGWVICARNRRNDDDKEREKKSRRRRTRRKRKKRFDW